MKWSKLKLLCGLGLASLMWLIKDSTKTLTVRLDGLFVTFVHWPFVSFYVLSFTCWTHDLWTRSIFSSLTFLGISISRYFFQRRGGWWCFCKPVNKIWQKSESIRTICSEYVNEKWFYWYLSKYSSPKETQDCNIICCQ